MNHNRHGTDPRELPPAQPREIRGIESFGRLDEQQLEHGGGTDPRYPSPKYLRQVSAFIVDCILHAGPMIAVLAILARDTSLAETFPQMRLWALISWPALSLIDRVVIQGIFHATAGKALFGLVVIQPEDGRWPTLGRLTKAWLAGLVYSFAFVVSLLGNYTGGGNGRGLNFALSTVRRKDAVAQLQTQNSRTPATSE